MTKFKLIGKKHKTLEELKNYSYFVVRGEIDTPYLRLCQNGERSILNLNLKTGCQFALTPETDVIEIELNYIEYQVKEGK